MKKRKNPPVSQSLGMAEIAHGRGIGGTEQNKRGYFTAVIKSVLEQTCTGSLESTDQFSGIL